MKNIVQRISQMTVAILLLGMAVSSAHAFTSMYVFGDALSTTTNNTSGLSQYYGKRYSNGRVWEEVLAQRQGIPIAMNWSYFDCNSSDLWVNVQKFSISPTVASNALFVIWCNNSDLFDETLNGNTNITEWTAAINRGQINHFRVITNLYAKGVRTLLMPSAVDVGRVPNFNHYANTNWVRLECIAYNNAFSNTLNQARAACRGLTIYEPDFFSLLDDALAHAANYGLTNALAKGTPIDAMDAFNYGFPVASTNGYGTNYIFWDYLDPTAKFHEIIADLTQQIISPVQIAGVIALNNSSNQLVVANVPMGLNGTIEVCTNLASPNWVPLQPVSSLATAQSYFIPTPVPPQQAGSNSKQLHPNDITPPGPGGTVIVTALQFYRMHYSYTWNWP